MKNLKKIKPEEAYSNVKFRESRNIDGTLLYKSSIDAREIIENLEVVNVVNNTTLTIKKLFNE